MPTILMLIVCGGLIVYFLLTPRTPATKTTPTGTTSTSAGATSTASKTVITLTPKIDDQGVVPGESFLDRFFRVIGFVQDSNNIIYGIVRGNSTTGSVVKYMRNEDDGMGIDPRTGEIKTLGELGRTPYQDEPFPSIFDTYGVRYAGFPVFLSPKVLPIERVTFIKTNPYAATLADTLSVETVYRIGLYEVFDRSTHHKNLDTSDGKSFSIITTAGIRVFRAREIFTTYSSNPLQQISNTISKFVSARVKVKTYEKYLKSDLSKFFDINELNVALKYIGVKVERFEVSDPEPSAKTQITLDTLATESTKIQEEEKKAAAAVFTKSKTITDAEAAKEKKRLEGEGEAAARQALLEAEALGQQKLNKAKAQEIDVLADKYKKTGMSKAGAYARATEIVLATRQAEAIGKLTGTYVAPSGDGGKGTNLLLGANSVGGNKKGGE